MLSHQRIPSPGEQAMAQDEWEGLIAREAGNYFDKLDVRPSLSLLRSP